MTIHLLAPKDQTKWPEIWHHCYNIWKTSPYEIKMWHDEDVDQLLKEDDEDFFINYLSKLKPIFKWDYIRPLILKKYGGAYFDIDVEIYYDFIPMVKGNKIYIIGGHDEDIDIKTFQNSIMISSLNKITFNFWNDLQQYFKYNIKKNYQDCLEPYSKIRKWQSAVEYAGPIALSRFVNAHKHLYPIETLNADLFNRGSNDIRFSFHHQTYTWR